MYMALDKSLMNIFWGLAEANETKFKNAKRLCNAIGIPLREEEFKSIKATERFSDENDYIAKSIEIDCDNYVIEVTILEDRYIVSKRFDESQYLFIKQYLYENNFLLEESFSLCADEDTFINITECYPSSYVVVENEDKMIMRGHTEECYIDFKNKEIFGMKDFTNEIREDDQYEFKEVVNFIEKDNLYYLSVRKNPEVGLFAAGATLNAPKYKLKYDDPEKEEGELLRALGLTSDRNLKRPKMYMYGNYQEGDINHSFEVDVLKDDKIIGLRVVDDKKNSNLYKIRINNRGAIDVDEIRFLRNCMMDILKDKKYKEWVVTYLDELLYRAMIRKDNDFRNINSYDGDIFDFLIIDGKSINGDEENKKKIEERAYGIYMGREKVHRLLDDVSVEPLEINEEKVLTM